MFLMPIHENKKKLLEIAILTLIVVLLQLAGYTVKVGDFSVSFIILPVVVGAVLCGPLGGAWLGVVFGIVLILTGETDAFLNISLFRTIICTSVRGALAGFFSGLVYDVVRRKNDDFAVVLAAIAAPAANTFFFIILALAFFYDVFESIMGAGNVVKGMLESYVSINFLIELALNMSLAPAVIHFAKKLETGVSFKKYVTNENKLATHLSLTVVLLGTLICVVSSSSGYRFFKNNMTKQYNDTAYQIAEIAREYLDNDLLHEYKNILEKSTGKEAQANALKKVTVTKEYQNIYDKLSSLCESKGASRIFVSVVDEKMLKKGSDVSKENNWKPLSYIFDCTKDGKNEFEFGDKGEVKPEFSDAISNSLEVHARSDDYFIGMENGINCTMAIMGVYEENTENLLAVIGVSFPMTSLESAIRSEVQNSLVTMICIEIIFITMYFYYISYRIIKPIKVISGEASNFVKSERSTGNLIEKINTHDEIQQLAVNIIKMENDIDKYILDITEITAERERIGTELKVASKIQADMLTSNFPEHKDFEIYASMTPAKEVGGDFYDFFLLDDNHLALIIADVSDKGVPGALFMVISKTLLKNQSSFTHSPKQILESVNNQLWQNNKSRMFVTVWIGILELSTGKCVAANAGHMYPVLRKANGEFELIRDDHGFVLAGVKNSQYDEYEFYIEKEGTLFVYTDGVTEATNQEEELFGENRMLDALNIDSSASPNEIISNVKNEISRFVGDAPQFDDITMLCFKKK